MKITKFIYKYLICIKIHLKTNKIKDLKIDYVKKQFIGF